MKRLLVLPRTVRASAILLGAILAALAIGGFFGVSGGFFGVLSFDQADATHGSASIHRCNKGFRSIPPCGAKGWYVKNSDTIVINDVKSDGKGGIIYWFVDGGNTSGVLRDLSGADGRPATDNRQLSEGKVIRFSVCLTNGRNVISATCSQRFSSGT